MQRLTKLLFLFLAAVPWLSQADWETNMPRGVTPISREVFDLHMLVLYICCALALLVYGVIIYSVFAHRKSRGVEPAKFSHSTTVEVVWTLIPFLILVAMVIPATNVLIDMEDYSESELTIKATALQWRWHYEYQDEEIDFYSALDAQSNVASLKNSSVDPYSVDNYLLDVDNPLVVPVGKRVQLLLTSRDVIHAWWVPELGMKRDAIPGYITRMWFRIDEAGTYRGQCAELCGRGHGYMPIVVEALNEEDYRAWLSGQRGEEDPTSVEPLVGVEASSLNSDQYVVDAQVR